THLHVREDNLSLYGFVTLDELRLFETLITVSGLGPKLALVMLSTMNAEQLTTAIASGDAALLQRIPGIGKKTSERLVLELKDKINSDLVGVPLASSAQGQSDVVAALVSLGYSVNEASRAAASLPSSDSSLEEKIKQALQYFAGSNASRRNNER
ncbi:MAG: Holliday junction branch migration protein RuvA, partial [Chloroflexota bacterium]